MRYFILVLTAVFFCHSANALVTDLPAYKQQPPAVQIAVQMATLCMKHQLGEDAAGVEEIVMQAYNEIDTHCRAKEFVKAKKRLHYYSQTPAGQAAFDCIEQLKPLLVTDNVRELVGKDYDVVTTLLARQLPDPICR